MVLIQLKFRKMKKEDVGRVAVLTTLKRSVRNAEIKNRRNLTVEITIANEKEPVFVATAIIEDSKDSRTTVSVAAAAVVAIEILIEAIEILIEIIEILIETEATETDQAATARDSAVKIENREITEGTIKIRKIDAVTEVMLLMKNKIRSVNRIRIRKRRKRNQSENRTRVITRVLDVSLILVRIAVPMKPID